MWNRSTIGKQYRYYPETVCNRDPRSNQGIVAQCQAGTVEHYNIPARHSPDQVPLVKYQINIVVPEYRNVPGAGLFQLMKQGLHVTSREV